MQTLRRIGALDSAFALDSPFKRHPTNWLDLIGCAVTERVYREATMKVPDADYSACTSDADVMRQAVEALRGAKSQDDAEIATAFNALRVQQNDRMTA